MPDSSPTDRLPPTNQSSLDNLSQLALQEISEAGTTDQLHSIQISYLGKNGSVNQVMRTIGQMEASQRPLMGKKMQQVRHSIEQALNQRVTHLQQQLDADRIASETLDVTLPARLDSVGSIHPVSQMMQRICSWFSARGYQLATGPEIEDTWHNFTALNMGEDHPARAMHDTFYFNPELLLRTHTSPVQIRALLAQKPPLRIICPGKVYRRDSDLTHTPMFHQVEGLVVDRDISLAQLKGTLQEFLHYLFGAHKELRFRTSFFPFTEPSVEVDVQCMQCTGSGCRGCKDGWLEILGAGLVHPQVLENCNLDSEQWSGFAFGMGIERLIMLFHGVADMRLCFENDLRFLHQF
ncbi:MAG: phenylalanine--tRNA ligase subunit alpha [Gammaproteobacteria bacterium]